VTETWHESGSGGRGGNGEGHKKAGVFTWVVGGAAIALATAVSAGYIASRFEDSSRQAEAAGPATAGEDSNSSGGENNNQNEGTETTPGHDEEFDEETHNIAYSADLLTTVHVDMPTGSGFRAMLLVQGQPFGEHLRKCGDDASCAILETAEADYGGENLTGGIISGGVIGGEDDGINFPIPRAILIDGVPHPVPAGNARLVVIPDGGGARRVFDIPANPGAQIGDPEE